MHVNLTVVGAPKILVLLLSTEEGGLPHGVPAYYMVSDERAAVI